MNKQFEADARLQRQLCVGKPDLEPNLGWTVVLVRYLLVGIRGQLGTALGEQLPATLQA